MRWSIVLILFVWTAKVCRRIRFWRAMGIRRAAGRVYRRHALVLGSLMLLAMALQEAVLLRAGLLTWRQGLPLHLCSLLGLLTLPMLLGHSRVLLAASLLAGAPGAALALLFPAALDTPWPFLTTLSFQVLHAGLVCAPMLPIALGWRPRAGDALLAWGLLAFTSVLVMAVNILTGGNYLFLAAPIPGTPLMLLSGGSPGLYRLRLVALVTAVLVLEGMVIHLTRKRSAR